MQFECSLEKGNIDLILVDLATYVGIGLVGRYLKTEPLNCTKPDRQTGPTRIDKNQDLLCTRQASKATSSLLSANLSPVVIGRIDATLAS